MQERKGDRAGLSESVPSNVRAATDLKTAQHEGADKLDLRVLVSQVFIKVF